MGECGAANVGGGTGCGKAALNRLAANVMRWPQCSMQAGEGFCLVVALQDVL